MVPEIINCESYTSKDKCFECKEGYRVNSEFICTANDNIPYCVTYNQK